MSQRWRTHLSFANVMASIAVFVAIGGTSYAAITLPRNSVGARELKSGAVAPAELRRGAVASRAIKNGGVRVRDLSKSARKSLRGRPGPIGPVGPPGPTSVALRASLSSGGSLRAGNANDVASVGVNKWIIGFPRSVAGCVPTATLARDGAGQAANQGPGQIVVTVEGDKVAVETYNAAGAPEGLPFNLIVAC